MKIVLNSMILRALLLAPILLTAGCIASSTLPPPLSEAERTELKGVSLPYAVAVEPTEVRATSDSLIRTLRGAGVFTEVAYMEEFAALPPLVARIESRPEPPPPSPLRTLLTFGIIPTTNLETHGLLFSLFAPGHETNRVLIDYRYHGRSTLGWVALFKALSPSETLTDPKSHPCFLDRFKRAVLVHSSTISEIATDSDKTAQ